LNRVQTTETYSEFFDFQQCSKTGIEDNLLFTAAKTQSTSLLLCNARCYVRSSAKRDRILIAVTPHWKKMSL